VVYTMSVVSPPTPSATVRSRSRQGLWSYRGFTLFWSGETVSMFGTQVTTLALPLTAVLTLHATAAQLGWIRFLGVMPFIVCTLVFGAWVDRRRRKPVLVLANAARAALVGLVPLFALMHLLNLVNLGIIAFAAGVFSVLFEVTWLAYVPTLVAPGDLVAANGRMSTSSAASEVAGPGLAGLLVQWFSAPLAMLADALSYVVAVATLLLIRTPEPAPKVAESPHLLREIGVGLRIVWDDTRLRAIAIMSGLWNCLDMIAETTFLLYAIRERGLAPGTLGAVFAIGAVGGLIGAAASTAMVQRGRFGPILGIAFCFGCLPWVVMPLVIGSQWLEAGAYAIAFFLVHIGLGLWAVLTTTLRQTITPLHLLGRTGASVRLISYGLGALGVLLAGFFGSVIGLRATLWLAAVGFLVILVVLLLATPLPRVRSLSGAMSPEELDAAAQHVGE